MRMAKKNHLNKMAAVSPIMNQFNAAFRACAAPGSTALPQAPAYAGPNLLHTPQVLPQPPPMMAPSMPRKGRSWVRLLSWAVVVLAAVIVIAVFLRQRMFVRVERRVLPQLTDYNPFGEDQFVSHIPRVEEVPSTPPASDLPAAAPAAAPAAILPAAPTAAILPAAAPAAKRPESPVLLEETAPTSSNDDPNFTPLDLS